MPTLQLQVNGEPRQLSPAPANLAAVIEQLGHHPRLVVVEFNGLILTPDRWDSQAVRDGDTLEIVTIVGGGS
jgi:sulfur carrier protein